MQLTINGDTIDLDVDPAMPLLWALRDAAGLKGTKFGCGVASCGACMVIIDGVATFSCVTAVGDVEGEVRTIEGLAKDGSRCRSAATASPGRSWPPWLCLRKIRNRAMPISTPQCPAICAGAVPIHASARR